jgi:hypothetical protein
VELDGCEESVDGWEGWESGSEWVLKRLTKTLEIELEDMRQEAEEINRARKSNSRKVQDGNLNESTPTVSESVR